MRIIVLGSAAGGGFPQWNCACRNCAAVRRGDVGFSPRTQSSLAVSANGTDFVLINASPDLRAQIESTRVLRARDDRGHRGSPIAAAVITNADVDHIGGLLTLREGQPFSLYTTGVVGDVIASNSVFGVLSSVVSRQTLALDTSTAIEGPCGSLGLSVTAFAVPGKVALFLERGVPEIGARTGDTIGLRIADEGGHAFYYIPGCATVDAPLAQRLADAPLVFFDGTLFTDDEMITHGLSPKTGRRMGHMPISGVGGSIAALRGLGIGRRIYVHVNNSNPVLDANSEARRLVEAAGWEVAHDGLEVVL